MKYLILLILLQLRVVFADCAKVSISPGKSYDFNCDGNIISVQCGFIKGTCEVDLNEKLKKYNIRYSQGHIESISSFNSENVDVIKCAAHASSLECQQENNCKNLSETKIKKLLFLSGKNIRILQRDSDCKAIPSPISFKNLPEISKYSCEQNLEKKGIKDLENRLLKECSQLHLSDGAVCQMSSFIDLIGSNISDEQVVNLFQRKKCEGQENLFKEDQLREMNLRYSESLIDFFSKDLQSCRRMDLDQRSIDQLICYKTEEFKFSQIKDKVCEKAVWSGSLESSMKTAVRASVPEARNITGQPEKENFTLPTEAPPIKNQETLQKIDKLIADNGGEMTPEIAKKAGEIFNAGIYQPTKTFINSVEQAIGNSFNSSARSSSKYKSNNGKSYEIGAKNSSVRTVANIAEEIPSAARATTINGKIATGGTNTLNVEAGNTRTENGEAVPTNSQNDKKIVGNSSAVSQGPSSLSGPSGSVASGGGSPSVGGAGSRSVEVPQLPSLSTAEKSEIAKVVQALKGAESSEDVRSIVIGEDNYAQVKRIIQELEQSKKSSNLSSEAASRRAPASTLTSQEVKEFEKTLEKFGIKVYGESSSGKAIYAPQTVNHVIVIKNNSIQFLNTIRGKR